jgi:hypothetical protein
MAVKNQRLWCLPGTRRSSLLFPSWVGGWIYSITKLFLGITFSCWPVKIPLSPSLCLSKYYPICFKSGCQSSLATLALTHISLAFYPSFRDTSVTAESLSKTVWVLIVKQMCFSKDIQMCGWRSHPGGSPYRDRGALGTSFIDVVPILLVACRVYQRNPALVGIETQQTMGHQATLVPVPTRKLLPRRYPESITALSQPT